MKDAVVALFSSRKSLIVILLVVLSAVAIAVGRATWDQVEGFMKWILMTWLGAQGIEDAAKFFANRPTAQPTVNVSAPTTVHVPSNPPPPL